MPVTLNYMCLKSKPIHNPQSYFVHYKYLRGRNFVQTQSNLKLKNK